MKKEKCEDTDFLLEQNIFEHDSFKYGVKDRDGCVVIEPKYCDASVCEEFGHYILVKHMEHTEFSFKNIISEVRNANGTLLLEATRCEIKMDDKHQHYIISSTLETDENKLININDLSVKNCVYIKNENFGGVDGGSDWRLVEYIQNEIELTDI